MTKAEYDPITGERTVAPKTEAAGRGRGCSLPGLTSEAARGQSSKAADDSITVGRTVSPETAAAAVALTAPSILELGKQLAAVEAAHDAFDSIAMRRALRVDDDDAERRMERRGKAAWEILDVRAEALRELISSMPAQSIQDAAVQVGLICTAGGRLAASVHTQEQKEALADGIERMALGILPILAQVAGLDIEAMGWAGNEYLRIFRFDGVGVTS